MNKTWFITGAGSGIGTGIAKAALRAGDRVVATGRNLEKTRNAYPDVALENIAWRKMPKLHIQAIVFIVAATLAVSRAFAQTSAAPPAIDIVRDSAGVHVTFTDGLQSAEAMQGSWTDVADAPSPFTIPTESPARFFRAVEKTNTTNNQMRIKIGSSTFIATLYDNATATAFKAMLPMTINMNELNGNEKCFSLSVNLPTDASNPGTIQGGDLMIYVSNVLVLFYETVSTSYSYTRLGRINDATGLAAAVGSGSVTVTYEGE